MSLGGTTPPYWVGDLLAFATALFRRAGLDPDKAGTIAEILVEGNLLGHGTHGLALAAPYLAALDAGRMTRHGAPAVVSDRSGALTGFIAAACRRDPPAPGPRPCVCRARRASHAGARPGRPASVSTPGSWRPSCPGPSGSTSSRARPRSDGPEPASHGHSP